MVQLQTGVELDDTFLTIHKLQLSDPEVLQYFQDVPIKNREEEAVRAFEIGISVMSRLQLSANVNYVEARFNELTGRVGEYFHNLDTQLQSLLNQNLNPNIAGSFLNQAHTLIAAQSDKIGASLAQALSDTRQSINSDAQRLQEGREQLDRRMDPTNSSGYLAALIQRIEGFEQQLHAQFSPTDSASFVGKLNGLLQQHFGDQGDVMQAIERRLAVDWDNPGKSPLGQVYSSLRQEIAELRDTIMKMAGQQELLEKTTKKGFPFEDRVFEELQRIAHPFGDVVEDTSLKAEAISGSKKGDYVYHLQGSDLSIVLDAKNYGRLKSLPAMLAYLKDAMRDRGSRIGVIVVPEKENLQKQIGSWNVYDKNIITPLEYLEISIKYAKFVLRLQSGDDHTLNTGLIQQKLEFITRKMKEITSVKSKLTKLANGVASSVADIQENLDSLRQDVNDKLLEIQSEFQKA